MTGLEADRIRVEVGGSVIIDGVSCSLETGSITALVGPNGAGKSTLLRALAGVAHPAAGTVRFDEADLLALHRRERARIAALVEQDAATEWSLTVAEVVALGRIPHASLFAASPTDEDGIVADALERVDMLAFADRDVQSLSGGERQRVLLAKAIAQQPKLLLLDEPTNHLDIRAQLSALELLGTLARGGATVLAALHDLTLAAAYCDAVVVLANGRVVAAGGVRETLTPPLIREVYGVDAVVLEHPTTGRPVIALSSTRDS